MPETKASESLASELGNEITESRFLGLFWGVFGSLVLYSLYAFAQHFPTAVLCGFVISASALLPIFLWCRGWARGLPMFPLFALTFIWSYGVQFLFYSEKLAEILSELLMWQTAALVSGSLLLGTACWFAFVRNQSGRGDRRVLSMSEEKATLLYFGVIVVNVIFTVASNAGMLFLLGGFYSVLRATVFGIGSLAIFCLGYRAGTGRLPDMGRVCYWWSVAVLCAASIATIFLVNGLSILFLAVAGYSLGRKQVAWIPLLVCLAATSLLHMGKAQMRAIYWTEEGQGNTLGLTQYPKFFAEWLRLSVVELATPKPEEEEPASLLERASTLRLLLFAETMAGGEVPFLKGETYRIIPQMLIPRFLNPNKLNAHEGTTILNVHYGFQTRESSELTTIGWGLFNEAYANFGVLGCLGIAIVLGSFYGVMTRWSIGMPLNSYRNFLGLFVMSLAVQSEFCASVYVGALFQGAIAITAFSLVVMRREAVSESSERVF